MAQASCCGPAEFKVRNREDLALAVSIGMSKDISRLRSHRLGFCCDRDIDQRQARDTDGALEDRTPLVEMRWLTTALFTAHG
jgi:hypothetical protein